MITSRRIEQDDWNLLEISVSKDEYHSATTLPEFFYDERALCNVYEDENGPVMFVRGTNALRVDIQFIDNYDRERNAKVMLEGFADFANKARNAGYTELIFNTDNPALKVFCTHKLKFIESNGEMRYFL